MFLSGDTIRDYVKKGELVYCGSKETYDPRCDQYMKSVDYLLSNIHSDNIDVRLGNSFKRVKTQDIPYIDLNNPPTFEEIPQLNGDGIFLHPGDFCLATSDEYVKLPNDIMAFVDARSTIGRFGLIVQTATFIHAGWEGRITLELKNEAPVPIRLHPYDVVAQLVFGRLDANAKNPYAGKYQGQNDTTAPK